MGGIVHEFVTMPVWNKYSEVLQEDGKSDKKLGWCIDYCGNVDPLQQTPVPFTVSIPR